MSALRQVAALLVWPPWTRTNSGGLSVFGEYFGSSWPAPLVRPALETYHEAARAGLSHEEALSRARLHYASDLDASEIEESMAPVWEEMDALFTPSGPDHLLLARTHLTEYPRDVPALLTPYSLAAARPHTLYSLPARIAALMACSSCIDLGPLLPTDSPAVLDTFLSLLGDSSAPPAHLLDAARRV